MRPSLAELQAEVVANRVRRGWESATNLEKTISGLAEEVGEFARAVRDGDRGGMIKELADVIIFGLGGLEILGVDAHQVVAEIVEQNKNRVYQTHH